LATDAEAVAGTSATLAVTPSRVVAQLLSAGVSWMYGADFGATTSGTGGLNDSFANSTSRRTNGPTSANAGYVAAQHAIIINRGGASTGNLDWSKRITLAARIQRVHASASNESAYLLTVGEPNSSFVDPSVEAIGVRVVGNGVMEILAHDGTTLTAYSTSHTPASGVSFDLVLVSDGSGTVEAFVNGSSVGSTTGGPTALVAGTAQRRNVYVKVSNTASFSSSPAQYFTFVPRIAVL
jgi:hypothetical protein